MTRSNVSTARMGTFKALFTPLAALSALLGGTACSGSSDSSQAVDESVKAQQAAVTAPAATVTCGASLSASLVYLGNVQTDGTAIFAPPLAFAIPSSLPISVGGSKNGKASLTFNTGAASVSCTYTLKNAASSFGFTSCSDGSAAGTQVQATSVVLHIQNADAGVATPGPLITITVPLSAPNGSSCGGDNKCFGSYTCQSGACVGGSPVACTAQDQCHVAGTCDPATGACSNPSIADGTTCDDSNLCSLADTCQAGVCTGTSLVQCSALDQCHVAGSCNPATGICSNPAADDGTACNDGNQCDVSDTCQSGVCAAGFPIVCTAQDQCHVPGACDPATGACSNPPIADGTVCNDGSSCNLFDTCTAGVCSPALSFTCASGQSCTDLPRTCVPRTCADLGFNCGPASDGCGGELDCGTGCPVGQICGGGGSAGVCGPLPVCTGLCTQQVACSGGETTSLRGHVFAPNGIDPIPNVLVYVPNSAVEPFGAQVACEQCGAGVSGSPLVSTHTTGDGSFVLENVPAGANIPVVIQIGRWRRQVQVPNVAACADNVLPAALSRLPRNKTEGDIPKTALVTGNVDALECLLRKIGLDDAEFTGTAGTGRINLYVGDGAGMAGAQPEAALFANQASLNRYDMTILACQGRAIARSPAQQQLLSNYASAGGRVFATHYSYTWLYQNPAFTSTAVWAVEGQQPPNPVTAQVDLANPRGQELQDWLMAVGASTVPGQIRLNDTRRDLLTINAPRATRWLYWTENGRQIPLHYTFDAPVGVPAERQCGRVLYSDFHIDNAVDTSVTVFPAECTAGPLTPQEHLLEFMLFDLSSCVSEAEPASCTPRTCAQQGLSCGPASDGCGHPLDCGGCTAPETCGGGTTPGVCGNPFCSP